jgi:hypothetical protein
MAAEIPMRDKLILDVSRSESQKKTIKHAAAGNKFLLWQQAIQRDFSVMCSGR